MPSGHPAIQPSSQHGTFATTLMARDEAEHERHQMERVAKIMTQPWKKDRVPLQQMHYCERAHS